MNVKGKEHAGLLQLHVNNKVKYGSLFVTVLAERKGGERGITECSGHR